MGTATTPLARALTRPASAVAVVPRILSDACTTSDDLLELSERLRMAGAAALVLHGPALDHVRCVLDEQRRAVGNYPGPVPVLYEAPGDLSLTDAESLHTWGASGVVLPTARLLQASAPPLPVVPRCESAAELEAAVSSSSPPSVAFAATEELMHQGTSEQLSRALSRSSSEPVVLVASLGLGAELSARARALRARGCSAVTFDFDADDWPAAPEALVAAVLSKRSAMIGSLGVQNNAYGTFASDQYWLNRQFKEARARGDKRESQYGSRHTEAARGGGIGGSTGGEAGSAIKKVDA